jgi:hypothetical protein
MMPGLGPMRHVSHGTYQLSDGSVENGATDSGLSKFKEPTTGY